MKFKNEQRPGAEQIKTQKLTSLLQEEKFADMVEDNVLTDEDFPIIETLSNCHHDIFVEHHNYWTSNKKDIIKALKNNISNVEKTLEKPLESDLSDEQKERKRKEMADLKQYYESFLKIAEKHDWHLCWRINRAFEYSKTMKRLALEAEQERMEKIRQQLGK